MFLSCIKFMFNALYQFLFTSLLVNKTSLLVYQKKKNDNILYFN